MQVEKCDTQEELTTFFAMIPCLAYASTLKMDTTCPPKLQFTFTGLYGLIDRLCGLLLRVPGYRSRGPEFDSRRYLIF
jgi:hypothetical protein